MRRRLSLGIFAVFVLLPCRGTTCGRGSDAPAATAVDAARVAPDGPLYGHKLTRAEALSHPRVKEFWEVVDLIVLNDPLVHQHHYGHAPA